MKIVDRFQVMENKDNIVRTLDKHIAEVGLGLKKMRQIDLSEFGIELEDIDFDHDRLAKHVHSTRLSKYTRDEITLLGMRRAVVMRINKKISNERKTARKHAAE